MDVIKSGKAVIGLSLISLCMQIQLPLPIIEKVLEIEEGVERRLPVLLTHEQVLHLEEVVNEMLANLSTKSEQLKSVISSTLDKIDKGEEVEVREPVWRLISDTVNRMNPVIDSSIQLFDRLANAAPRKSKALVNSLRKDTVSAMREIVNSMNDIIKIEKTLRERKRAVIVVDQDRMNFALSEKQIHVDKKLSREEKRRLILQHA
ncbi:hypothetical protein [Xenorhabdus sp. SGI240]|uniref:hypothetical protein n=1 Tax=Xenorhabdus sp. SGI240 TaxID=3158262 RepID=UPI0032B854F8